MTDILIRDVPDAVVAGLDAAAARAGISRVEYVRRTLAADVDRAVSQVGTPLSRQDWQHLHTLTSDLAEDEVMRGAWS